MNILTHRHDETTSEPFINRLPNKERIFMMVENAILTSYNVNYEYNKNCYNGLNYLDMTELLLNSWINLEKRCVFRYYVGSDQLKKLITSDKQSFVLQLNDQRFHNRRPQEFIMSTNKLVDTSLFNFNLIKTDEIVCVIDFSNDYIMKKLMKSTAEVIIVPNISPSNMYHYLIIPFPTDLYPQKVTLESLFAVIKICNNLNYKAFVGFNGLGAYASVNHLHFHLHITDSFILPECYSLKQFCENDLIVELVQLGFFTFLRVTIDNPLEINSNINKIKAIVSLLEFFTNTNVPYNLAICKPSPRHYCSLSSLFIFIIPKKMNYIYTSQTEKIKLYPTFFEYLGLVTVGDNETYETITLNDIVDELKKYILPESDIITLLNKFLETT